MVDEVITDAAVVAAVVVDKSIKAKAAAVAGESGLSR
jgi:hypothetical protein